MDSVDDIPEPLTEDYVTLYKENSVLKSKMRILWKKLEEYRKQGGFPCRTPCLPRRRRATRWSRTREKVRADAAMGQRMPAPKRRTMSTLSSARAGALDAAKCATSQFLDGMEKRLKRQLELIDEPRRRRRSRPPQPEEPERVHTFTPAGGAADSVLTPKEQK